jgi:hypothetical protein
MEGGVVLVVVLAGAFCLVAELLVGSTLERFLIFAMSERLCGSSRSFRIRSRDKKNCLGLLIFGFPQPYVMRRKSAPRILSNMGW